MWRKYSKDDIVLALKYHLGFIPGTEPCCSRCPLKNSHNCVTDLLRGANYYLTVKEVSYD